MSQSPRSPAAAAAGKRDQAAMALAKLSTIRIYGDQAGECGYCKSGADVSKETFGITSAQMSVEDYQKLMLVGWRRSGDYFYKPTNHNTCCPQYTIRLKAAHFEENRVQRQVRRKVRRFIETGDVHALPATSEVAAETATAASASRAIPEPVSSEATIDPAESKSNAAVAPLQLGKQDLTIEMHPAVFNEESFALYCKYQTTIHKSDPEELTPKAYTRFLVYSPLIDPDAPAAGREALNSPLVYPAEPDSGEVKSSTEVTPISFNYGTYHQLYRLNGQLIAVGVVDLLPSGLSSVYLYYDPDQRHLILGKYTALKEIDFCRKYGLEYYYMGFYIHDCEKMKYKGDFHPSELLCPTSLQWFPIKDCFAYLKHFKFSPFEPSLAAKRRELADKDAGATKDQSMALAVFAPKFGSSFIDFDFSSVPLDLSGGKKTRLCHISDLTAEGQRIVKRMLLGMFAHSGAVLMPNVVVVLN